MPMCPPYTYFHLYYFHLEIRFLMQKINIDACIELNGIIYISIHLQHVMKQVNIKPVSNPINCAIALIVTHTADECALALRGH